jgi:hypothetical protein
MIPGRDMSVSKHLVWIEMTLVKSFHSFDPDVIQNMWTCKNTFIREKELASATCIRVKAIKSLLGSS